MAYGQMILGIDSKFTMPIRCRDLQYMNFPKTCIEGQERICIAIRSTKG